MKKSTILVICVCAVAAAIGIYFFIKHRNKIAAVAGAPMPDGSLKITTKSGYNTLLDMANGYAPIGNAPQVVIKGNSGSQLVADIPATSNPNLEAS